MQSELSSSIPSTNNHMLKIKNEGIDNNNQNKVKKIEYEDIGDDDRHHPSSVDKNFISNLGTINTITKSSLSSIAPSKISENDSYDLDKKAVTMEKKKEIFLKKTPDPGQLFDCLYFQGTEHENIHMKYRNIGKNGLRVPILAFSAWSNFSHVPEHIAGSIIEAALENGVNYFDTGDSFEQGQAETLLGTVLKKGNWPRSSYILSTKIFWKTGPSAHRGAGLSRKFIIEAVEASLRRLQTKYIDILIIHKLDAMCPMEEIVRCLTY
ncbi:uncharacterized protein NH340_JMT01853 [Sarcoptes scabiei]|nr:uncharacterized protein NH340_JMT01853 [Sarcoptes scabiei]